MIQGDTTHARAAYQDFLTLWKDADPDIPILKQAKAEYAKIAVVLCQTILMTSSRDIRASCHLECRHP